MPSTTRSFQTRLDAVTADHARREADRCGLSLEEWVVSVLRRELSSGLSMPPARPLPPSSPTPRRSIDDPRRPSPHRGPGRRLLPDRVHPRRLRRHRPLPHGRHLAGPRRRPSGSPRRPRRPARSLPRSTPGRRTPAPRAPPPRARRPARPPAEWHALVTRGLFAAKPLATAVYEGELARGLRALGYEVRADAHGFVRILGVPEAAIDVF